MGNIITYPLRIILETNSGVKESYKADAFITLNYGAKTGVFADMAYVTGAIERMHSCSWEDAVGANITYWYDSGEAGKEIWDDWGGHPEEPIDSASLFFSQSHNLEVGTSRESSTDVGGGVIDNIHLAFTQRSGTQNIISYIPATDSMGVIPGTITDPIYRYKFFGSKVCTALSIPENQWVYTDEFRVSNRSDRPHNFGNPADTDLMANKLFLREGLTISSQGTITGNLPFHVNGTNDQMIYFSSGSTSGTGSINKIMIGYTRGGNTEADKNYGIYIGDGFEGSGSVTMSAGIGLEVSSSVRVGQNLTLGDIANVSQSIADASQTGTGGGNFDDFTVTGDTGTFDIEDGSTLHIDGGNGITTTSPSDGTISIALSNGHGGGGQPTSFTTIYNASLHIGEDNETEIDFSNGNVIHYKVDNANRMYMNTTGLYPSTNNSYTLGNGTQTYSDLFLGNGGVINFDNGDTTLTDNGASLDIAGADFKGINIDGHITASGNISGSSTSTLSMGGQATFGTITMTGKIDTAGEVEAEHLHATDDIEVGHTIYHSGDTNTKIVFTTDNINFYSDNSTMLSLNKGWASTNVVVNEQGADINFRVESEDDPYCLFIDGADNCVGIGVTDPGICKFDVIGGTDNFYHGTAMFRGGPNETGSISIQSTENVPWSIAAIKKDGHGLGFGGTSGASANADTDYPLMISSSGEIGVNTLFPSAQFHVNGTILGDVISGSLIRSAGDVIAYYTSDERLKDDIELITNPLEKINKLKGVSYRWNGKQDIYPVGNKDSGIIAQDVEAVLPELVQTNPNGYLGVKHDRLVGLLIEGIKEQQQQIDELKLEVKNLKGDT